MKLSKYYHYVELENNMFAIFNSLIMDVLFVNKEKLDEINSLKVKSENENKKLKDIGVFITECRHISMPTIYFP